MDTIRNSEKERQNTPTKPGTLLIGGRTKTRRCGCTRGTTTFKPVDGYVFASFLLVMEPLFDFLSISLVVELEESLKNLPPCKFADRVADALFGCVKVVA